MISENNIQQNSGDEFSFSTLLANTQDSFEKLKESLEIARAMKSMQYTMPDIFNATGLQPEIIQSL